MQTTVMLGACFTDLSALTGTSEVLNAIIRPFPSPSPGGSVLVNTHH